jgi:hypothetical protein
LKGPQQLYAPAGTGEENIHITGFSF